MAAAFDALARLCPDGIQLTPGNPPTAGFAPTLPVRTHHGFAFDRWKRPVWSDDGRCLVDSDSVHPPAGSSWWAWVLDQERPPVLETMYPGHGLGTGAELDAAMDAGLALAVDVSHVFIQRHAGVIGPATWARLQDYGRIAEVHVSANPGTTDAHQPLTPDTFGLGWAKARLRAGTPVILESYFHRVGHDQRRAQLDLVRA